METLLELEHNDESENKSSLGVVVVSDDGKQISAALFITSHLFFRRKYFFSSGVFKQGRIQGGVLGDKPPPFFWEIFFNLLGFFKEKNPKTPPKFSRS